jgi:hypothetical protein
LALAPVSPRIVSATSRLEIVLGQTLGSATVALIHGSIAAGFRPAHPLLLPLLFMALIAIICRAICAVSGRSRNGNGTTRSDPQETFVAAPKDRRVAQKRSSAPDRWTY